MDFFSIILIAIALAMDAFSVSISCGVIIHKLNPWHYFRLAFFFGLFQFIMPLIGYIGGYYVEHYIRSVDHWIAAGLLCLVSIKMIKESFDEENTCSVKDPSKGYYVILLAIATSIDALAVGLSFGVLQKSIIVPSIIIGIVCALFSLVGVTIGKQLKNFTGKKAELFGGVMLLFIAAKILYDHRDHLL